MSQNNNEIDRIIFGKSNLKRVVGLECTDNVAEIFIQAEDGTVYSIFNTNQYWLLCNKPLNQYSIRLNGDLHYKWANTFKEREYFQKFRRAKKHEEYDIYSIWNSENAYMVKEGVTFYRDMKPSDLSVISFDLETTGLDGGLSDAKVLLISTTFVDHLGNKINKLFAIDEYENESEMILDFCSYVRETNPSLIIGHNIITYDFPYLAARAEKLGIKLEMGRNDSEVTFSPYDSKFRLDGTRELLYKAVSVYGREICDTYFLVTSFDVGKKYESHALKPLIKELGFEKEGRQFYDASTIRENYTNPIEWEKIKQYAIDDAEDSFKIWEMMGPTYFFSANNIPRPFTELLLSATGAKINDMLVRSYLQDKHSIPKATDLKDEKLEGGISFGIPGVYTNVMKVDLKSAYPSQILRFKIFDEEKDPFAYFYKIVKYFTEKRFEYKKLSKETGEKKWEDLDSTSKIFINSAYGTLSTFGLNFNSPENAAKITRETRSVISTALKWASGQGVEHYMEKYGNKEFESDIKD